MVDFGFDKFTAARHQVGYTWRMTYLNITSGVQFQIKNIEWNFVAGTCMVFKIESICTTEKIDLLVMSMLRYILHCKYYRLSAIATCIKELRVG